MGRHILIINGHPDPSAERLSAGLAHAYAEAAESAGHGVHRIQIGALQFPLLRKAEDFLTEPVDDAIVMARGQILLADHLVFIYPLWLGGPPALLKAFLEQVSRAEFALGAGGKGFPAGKLKGRTARIIVTMGMPAPIYQTFFGGHGVKALNRGILNLSGIRPVKTTYFGNIADRKSGEAAIARARALGRRAA